MSIARSAAILPSIRCAARNYASCGNCSARPPTRPMCLSRRERRRCPRGRFGLLWRARASWPGCPLCSIRINSGMRAGITSRRRAMQNLAATSSTKFMRLPRSARTLATGRNVSATAHVSVRQPPAAVASQPRTTRLLRVRAHLPAAGRLEGGRRRRARVLGLLVSA